MAAICGSVRRVVACFDRLSMTVLGVSGSVRRVVACFDRLSMTRLGVVGRAGAVVVEADATPGLSSPVMLSLSKHDLEHRLATGSIR